MALIGKDGKDDCAVALGLQMLRMDEKFLGPLRIAPRREYIRVALNEIASSPGEHMLRARHAYWTRLQQLGFVDMFVASDDSATAILAVNSEDEARELIGQDPIVQEIGFHDMTFERIDV